MKRVNRTINNLFLKNSLINLSWEVFKKDIEVYIIIIGEVGETSRYCTFNWQYPQKRWDSYVGLQRKSINILM